MILATRAVSLPYAKAQRSLQLRFCPRRISRRLLPIPLPLCGDIDKEKRQRDRFFQDVRKLNRKLPERLRIPGMTGVRHCTVKHSSGEYVHYNVHTNGIESFWSMFKRGFYGTYHKMGVQHLQRYVNEFVGRHNVREFDTIEQMGRVVTGMAGKRLRYRDLVG